MQSYGIRNNVLNWITAFINGRSRSVCVNNVLSSFLSVTNGVPQGSVLSPILFIIYITNLNDCCPANTGCNMYLYADDAKIFGHDSTQVQNCINKMMSWMENYQLTLSPAKCQYLPISCKPYNINHTLEYHINCYNIPTTFSVCDLGVVISSDLKWNNHISKIVAKASIGLYHISHFFNSNNIWILLKAYTTYVSPKLEYNTSIWSPYLIKDIAKIESIQKQFTRYICIRCKVPFSSYHDRLNKLNIKSLEYR